MQFKVLSCLHAHDVPVALPILTRDNTCYASRDDKLYSLAPYLPSGNCPDEQALFNTYGVAIATFHRAMAKYPEKIDSWRMDLGSRIFDEAADVLQKHLPENDRQPLFAVLASNKEEMKSAWSGLPEQYIHGDCHGGNIIVNDGRVTGFIDCDHLPLGPRPYDLAYLLADRIKNALFDGREAACLPMFQPLIAGYNGVNPLTPAEKCAIWRLILAVQVLFTSIFAQQSNAVLIGKNLKAFYWTYEHKAEIQAACGGGLHACRAVEE
jgi:Ser/Thr protein kinase RdoA (MazF antagonist)